MRCHPRGHWPWCRAECWKSFRWSTERMRAVWQLGTNFLRTQWLVLTIMAMYLIGISGVFGFHEQRFDVLFYIQWHSFYVIILATIVAVPAIHTERRSR